MKELSEGGYQGYVLIPVIDSLDEFGLDVTADVKDISTRTQKQNASMHMYFTMLANTLNEAGLDFRTLLKEDAETPWNSDMVKEFLWRKIQIAVTNIKSTSKISKNMVNDVYNILSRHLSEKHNIVVPFPNKYGD